MDRWKPVPKVAAALAAAVGILGLVALAQTVGLDLAVEGRAAVVLIVAALGPAAAGWLKGDR